MESLKILIIMYKEKTKAKEFYEKELQQLEQKIMTELQKYPDKKWETAEGDKFTAYSKKTVITEKYLRENFDDTVLERFKEPITKVAINVRKAVDELGIEPEVKEMLKVTLK